MLSACIKPHIKLPIKTRSLIQAPVLSACIKLQQKAYQNDREHGKVPAWMPGPLIISYTFITYIT